MTGSDGGRVSKSRPFPERLIFAIRGVRAAWRSEASFRTHAIMSLGALGALFVLRPEPVWWALFLLVIAAVLATELVNTALEHIVDRLHPEIHPLIGLAKDCAAGAVLVFSLAAVGIFGALLWSLFLSGRAPF